MGQSPLENTSVTNKRSTNAVVVFTMTALDTTWRMAVPILSGFILGLVIDKSLNTTPWIMIVGLLLGISLSALLIKKQLKALNK